MSIVPVPLRRPVVARDTDESHRAATPLELQLPGCLRSDTAPSTAAQPATSGAAKLVPLS